MVERGRADYIRAQDRNIEIGEPMSQDHIAGETEKVRADWARRGSHWDRQSDFVAETADRFNEPLIEAAGIESGHAVLDLATGAGEPALTIAERVGAQGRVAATDLVPEMMAGAKRRAAEKGLENITFRQADMCDLPDADAVFDRATCRFGLMFVPGPERATREAFRVLKPGGRAAFLVWGPRADTTMFTVFAEAAEALWGADDPLVDFDRMVALGETGRLKAALEAGGFVNVEEKELRFAPKIPIDQEPWHAQIDMSMGPKLDTLDPSARGEVEAAIKQGFSRYIVDGAYHMTAHVRIGVGEKA